MPREKLGQKKEGTALVNLSTGITLLVIVTGLVFFGLAQRVLDRMRLTDRTAIILLGIMFLGFYLPNIPLPRGVFINLGGLIPLGIALYLIITADTHQEQLRGMVASFGVMSGIYLTDKFLSLEPGGWILDTDPLYTGGIIAAVIAYLLGRSRRLAFASAILGLILVDIIAVIEAGPGLLQGSGFIIGGAGLFDVLMISGVLAVLLAEGVGEIRERIARGPAKPPLANALGVEEEDEGDDN